MYTIHTVDLPIEKNYLYLPIQYQYYTVNLLIYILIPIDNGHVIHTPSQLVFFALTVLLEYFNLFNQNTISCSCWMLRKANLGNIYTKVMYIDVSSLLNFKSNILW